MSIKLEKAQKKELESLRSKLRALEESVAHEEELYRETCNEARNAFIPHLEAYNEVLEEVQEFTSNLAATLKDKIEDYSEKWQESDTGLAASEFADEWESFNPDKLELPDEVEEMQIEGPADEFDGLRDESE